MGDWTYFPRCRYDSQGQPLSPFRDGTPVGTSDHGFAWGSQQSTLTPPNPTPNLTLGYTNLSEGYVVDDTDGLLLDDIGGIFINAPWPGGTISLIDVTLPGQFAIGVWSYALNMRRRSDGTTILITSGTPVVHGPFGPGPFATNIFTGLAWVPSEVMGSSATYDFYITNTANSTMPPGGTEYVQYSAFQITFTPLSGSVISVSPSTGTVAGGQAVAITGTGFTGATVVEFGGIAATAVVVVNDTLITAVTPAHESGVVDVEVIGVGTLTDGYLYAIPQLKLPPLPSRTPIMQGTQQGTARRRG